MGGAYLAGWVQHKKVLMYMKCITGYCCITWNRLVSCNHELRMLGECSYNSYATVRASYNMRSTEAMHGM